MPEAATSTHVIIVLRAVGLLLLWFLLFKLAHLVVVLIRHGPLIGWGIGPFGVTVVSFREPPVFFIWLNVFFPALVSSLVLYIGLFTPLAIIHLPAVPIVMILVILGGVLLSSTLDFLAAVRDVRFPLWGEARILWTLQTLQASWSRIHFTSFGLSYLRDHFHSTPTDLLRVM